MELGIGLDMKLVIVNFGGQVCGASDSQDPPPNFIKLSKDAYNSSFWLYAWPAYATGQAYKEEYLALSLHPFVTLRGFKGSGSFLADGVGNENFRTVERKPMRNLDLEKLPEEYMDEPSEMAGVKVHTVSKN
ncbi:hypothetical protein LWI29_021983 [Acer saccharum]|uniref:Uncharacterized protein n=1 Tax=Acer saccharum TaxID=4024 RepID=A0AA39RD71_ACESA|nr:hypothetical protein LWI29_021983 [Acer saccharum]